MIKKAEGDLLDNGLLDVQRHEAHHLRVGLLLDAVLLLDSLGERFAFAVGKEKEWGSASQSCFFGLNGIFSFWFKKTKQLAKQPTIKTRRGKNFTLNLALTFSQFIFCRFCHFLLEKLPSLPDWTNGHANTVVSQFLGFFTVFRMAFKGMTKTVGTSFSATKQKLHFHLFPS